MPPVETELEMVLRHVREGERQVANQHEIVPEISERGEPTEFALLMLMQFEQGLNCAVTTWRGSKARAKICR